MDLKRIVGFWLWLVVLLPGHAQTYGDISDKEAAAYMQNMSLHTIDAIRQYFYFMQGVDPLTTSQKLDNGLALAENDLIVLEHYALQSPAFLRNWKKISGYWYNIRNRCVHSPMIVSEKRLFEHLNNMKRLLVEWQNLLNDVPSPKTLDEFQYRTQFVALLYILKHKYPNSVYTKWLDVEVEAYKKKMQTLSKTLTSHSVKSSEQTKFFRLLNDYMATLLADSFDPQKVYELTESILQRLKTY